MTPDPSASKSDTAFRTISEVAEELGLPQHVLRFWETRFPSIKPLYRAGRRYYRPEDVAALRRIQSLLHQEGYTIEGARKALGHNHHHHPQAEAGGDIISQLSVIRSELVGMQSMLAERLAQ